MITLVGEGRGGGGEGKAMQRMTGAAGEHFNIGVLRTVLYNPASSPCMLSCMTTATHLLPCCHDPFYPA